MWKLGSFFLLLTVGCVKEIFADMYLHNPRGSNNRLNGNKRARQNNNRMFDSQNNQRGGYNVGTKSMVYYAGSKLQIEWTNQHSCDDKNNFCEIILQYMCDSNLRDGTTTGTIQLKNNNCNNKKCDTDEKYGMHENYNFYHNCRLRERNKGLFTADQDMNNRDTAVSTRQDNNGKNNRYGYECPEERDYYPYWHYSPWKDIAVVTNNPERCPYYRAESANVKSRWECYFSPDDIEKMIDKVKSIPNNKEDCEKFRYPEKDDNRIKGVWKEFPAHGIPAPECRQAQFTRDNHLGNGVDGQPNRYNWTLPDLNEDKCALRIRYNISTNDFDGWNTNASVNADNANKPTKLDLSSKFGFDNYEQAKERGYVFENDPEVKIFEEGTFNFRLAVDTSQFARTFQDRSHKFSIKKRPSNIQGTIHNLNVRGKRGNIVQVYPAVEYDFVPNVLEMQAGDYVHIQWTGSDTNPNNNDGQGKAGTDRNNILLLKNKNYPEGNGVQYAQSPTYGQYGNNYPMHLKNSSFLGFPYADLEKLAFCDPDKADPNLNQVSAYFNLGLRQVQQLGTYHYVSTRNNDFSNRDQKGRVIVTNMPFTDSVLDFWGGDVALPNGAGAVHAAPGTFDSLQRIRMEVWSKDAGLQKLEAAGSKLTQGQDYVSDFLIIHPETVISSPGKKMSIFLKLSDPDASNIDVYRTSSASNFALWTKMDAEVNGNMATFQASSGGLYVAKTHSYTVLIVSLVVAIVVVALIIAGTVFYFRRNPSKWKKLKSNASKLPDNFKTQV